MAEVVRPSSVNVERGEVLRMLGYRRGGKPSAKVAARLDTLWPAAMALLEPVGVWRSVDIAEAHSCEMPSPTPSVGIGLATIGARLEARVTACGAQDQPLDALLLDAFGSVAVESVTDIVNAQICSYATAEGHNPAPRISPGYGRWQVTAQPAFFALLPACEVGISLTENGMMVPHKSVSFAVRYRGTPSTERARVSRCERCGSRTCAYRIEPPESSS